MKIRPGDDRDLPVLLDMFDEAVAWMVARGNTEQWGTEPWSAQPRRVDRVRGIVARADLVSRRHAGKRIGARLLDHARGEARARGVGMLPVDCFAGGTGDLVRYYTRNGFTPTETFPVGVSGQVFEQRL